MHMVIIVKADTLTNVYQIKSQKKEKKKKTHISLGNVSQESGIMTTKQSSKRKEKKL